MDKNLNRLILGFVLVLVAIATGGIFLSSSTQQSGSPLPVPDGWRKVDLPKFFFFVPADMEPRAIRGEDSEVWRYESNGIRLDIDFGIHSNDLQSFRGQEDYSEDSVNISGKRTRICSFRLDEPLSTRADYDYRLIAGAHFPKISDGSEKLTFWASCRDTAGQETAKTIFRTITFNKSR